MGGSSNKVRVNYTDHDLIEEISIREYERNIGAFKKNLGQVMSRICLEKDIISIPNLDEYILRNFSENFLNLIRQEFFYRNSNGQKYYDARKISLLLFLLTNDSIVGDGRMKYHDKASFIINFVKTREDQSLVEPLDERDESLLNFIDDLVEVTIEGILNGFLTIANTPKGGNLEKMKFIKKEISKAILKILFYSTKEQRSVSLTFTDLSAKFDEDKWLFTSGFIRDAGWLILKDGKANELDKN